MRGADRRSSPPPLTAETCLRTAFRAAIGRPERNSRRCSRTSSASGMPRAGIARSADAPPLSRSSTGSSFGRRRRAATSRRVAARLPRPGIGCSPRRIVTPPIRSGAAERERAPGARGAMTMPRTPGIARTAPRAIATDALPAPATQGPGGGSARRPRLGDSPRRPAGLRSAPRSQRHTSRSGSTARRAASKMARASSRRRPGPCGCLRRSFSRSLLPTRRPRSGAARARRQDGASAWLRAPGRTGS